MSVIKSSAPTSSPYRRAKWRARLGMVACGLLVCALSGWLGVQTARPYTLSLRLRAANDDLERDLLRYRLENQRAEKEIRALRTDDGILRAARQLGYTRPNERKLRIPND